MHTRLFQSLWLSQHKSCCCEFTVCPRRDVGKSTLHARSCLAHARVVCGLLVGSCAYARASLSLPKAFIVVLYTQKQHQLVACAASSSSTLASAGIGFWRRSFSIQRYALWGVCSLLARLCSSRDTRRLFRSARLALRRALIKYPRPVVER